MNILLPIGTIVEYTFPPDLERNDNCGNHGHTWKYRIEGHEPAIAENGEEFIAEIIKPIERICKDQWFLLERGEKDENN